MSSNVSVTGADSLGDWRVVTSTVVAALPTAGTALAMMALFFTVGSSPVPNTATLVYGLANVAVVVGLFRWLPADARRSVFRYDRPSTGELAAAVALAVVSVGLVAPAVFRVTSALGLRGGPSVATFESAGGALVVGVGAILIAPVAEEVLFRGLLFGTLLARFGPRVAILGSSAAFGAIHVFLGGVPSVVEAAVLGVGFAAVRHRYANLVGVGVAHALINAYYVAAGVGILPSPVGG